MIVEEETEAHNITMDIFCLSPVTPNTQGENENALLTSEITNNSDALAETLKVLTINNAGYYNPDKNDAEGNIASNQKVATHTSYGKKRKVTDNTNINLQQKLLINQNLLIITTIIDPRIPVRVATCGSTPRARTTPANKQAITDVAGRSARVLRTPGHVSRTDRDGTTPRKRNVFGMGKGPVMIGGATVYPTCGIMGIQDVVSKKWVHWFCGNWGYPKV